MKWFISMPMNGKSADDIAVERDEIVREILDEHPEDEVIDSVIGDYNPCDGNVAVKYLSRSIEMLADADIVYFGRGWKDARGCRIEHDIAIAYGFTVIEDNN